MMSKDCVRDPSHTPVTALSQTGGPHHTHTLQLSHTRPYRGELPALAGLLLYPDTPDKMESTSRRAFCLRPGSRPERGGGLKSNLSLEGNRCFLTTQRESYHPHPVEGAPRAARHRRHKGREEERRGKDEVKEKEAERKRGDAEGARAEREKVLSLYQQDFPPPSLPRRKRSLIRPPPDNMAVNPALRAEFRTVQRDAYSLWSLTQDCRPSARLRATGQPGTYPE